MHKLYISQQECQIKYNVIDHMCYTLAADQQCNMQQPHTMCDLRYKIRDGILRVITAYDGCDIMSGAVIAERKPPGACLCKASLRSR